jgi:dihydrolipoamide dehydrogenase
LSKTEEADLVVLGGGPGGYSAAFRAADLGLNVILIDSRRELGGVCLNVGCIPSKALLHIARVTEEARQLKSHGIEFNTPEIKLNKLRGWKNQVVAQMANGLSDLSRQRHIRILHGEGRFVDMHELRVRGQQGESLIHFKQAVIAVGSHPARLPFLSDDPRIMDSTGALELADVPYRLLVLGGGIIGLEMATIYAALGSRITIVELTNGLLPGCDPDLVKPLYKNLAERCERVLTGITVRAVESHEDGLLVHFDGSDAPEAQLYSKVLTAVGRNPNGNAIDAHKAEVKVDEEGYVKVDRQQRTSVHHIFAIGDVAGKPMLAHKAAHEGGVAAEVAAGMKIANEAQVIPAVAYTDPEVAWVGLTETQADQERLNYSVTSFPWKASGRALTLDAASGLTKILVDKDSGVLIGAGMVGPNAGELIAEATLAIELGCEPGDLGLTVHPHPTLAETLSLAAEVYEGTVTELYLGVGRGRA